MNSLKEGWKGVKEKIASTLHNAHLLGDDHPHNELPELIVRATAKTLEIPDEQINQQIVEHIYQEVEHGMRTKDIVHLLKQRLKSNNPHKQWLGVLLLNKVMQDCAGILKDHEAQLLQGVAHVVVAPARSDTHDGKLAQEAARDLLSHFGKAGHAAYRTAYIEVAGEQGAIDLVPHIPDPMNTGVTDTPLHIIDPMNTGVTDEALHIIDPMNTGITDKQPTLPDCENTGIREQEYEAPGAVAKKLQADHDLHLLMPRARECCAAIDAALALHQAPDKEMVEEVRELRGMLGLYLNDMQALSGHDVEALIVEAVGAADVMDATLAKVAYGLRFGLVPWRASRPDRPDLVSTAVENKCTTGLLPPKGQSKCWLAMGRRMKRTQKKQWAAVSMQLLLVTPPGIGWKV
eukprot:CAMPEP_0202866596 /NCGR_PEP_ID=MMETSP1391-20130828/8105_1 /ASSEMBLY_ACC=CAM_ASM_000867 /TAXON_ID=1034604 /ORGANISM="Chlamydomonas leiostraca, Strain SAG 11-49" /LENGTH=403 /DNA_ID=CAMNT_0049546561 /DNA_START=67 /DNA_END=1279 /DNA_ORIENTATION=-